MKNQSSLPSFAKEEEQMDRGFSLNFKTNQKMKNEMEFPLGEEGLREIDIRDDYNNLTSFIDRVSN